MGNSWEQLARENSNAPMEIATKLDILANGIGKHYHNAIVAMTK